MAKVDEKRLRMNGWKLGMYGPNVVLIELEIPTDARVKHIRKTPALDDDRYRCDKALVKRITSLDGRHVVDCATSLYPKFDDETGRYNTVTYRVGEIALSNGFDSRGRFGRGIYFFDTKDKAINY